MRSDSPPEKTVLVPVANDEAVSRQLETAVDVAADRSSRLLFLYVLVVPDQLSLVDGRRYLLEDEDEQMLASAVRAAEERGVAADSRIRIARGVATGIVGSVEEYDVDAVLMGWRGRPPRSGIVLGSYLDRVLRNAACDVLVERIRTPRPDVSRVLVPVAGGPHDAFAAEAAAAIARERDASVTLLHVLERDDPELERAEANALLAETASRFEDVSSVERVLEGDDVAGTITDRTADHDVTALGVSRGGILRRRLLGTVSEGVARHAAGSVVLARRYEPVSSRLRRVVSRL
ncbi:universal stress protein [Natronobacterium gregoryi]|uniref:Universal stress protein UspA n=2 Tax=Natronobacterium gregoryi TaxID=44930 RepID=L0AFK4_NATGS|nr:universal stress protein [Natronobacterium gregoryi]AFZ71932.1 universal stress protein UspA-like protein [Natronobacterium gregoryi SP2]ELY62572.1 UspA domain-containing protein [Natronobacterium gregoryi SP2]PLK20711.1 universal stress protein UspA [Natronobacterium gregoryi SP2]SFJ13562.1 Nucleotide-binding universal stress protein, UspA family [Natronobacterium gregoryi]